MTRKLIATVLAAAMAITSVNIGTAQAGDRDVAKIIVGATALAIIGSALAAENRNNQTVTRSYRNEPQYYRHGNRYHDRRYDGRKGDGHINSGHNRRPVVARECLTNVRGQNGWTQGYATRCAQHNPRAQLPSDCVRRNFANGPRLYYAPQCLRQFGFNA